MDKELKLLIAVALILEPLHPALTPLIDDVGRPEIEQPAQADETAAGAEADQGGTEQEA